MSKLSFQDMVKIGDNKAIVLCRGQDENGKFFFHYIRADRKNIEQMFADYDSGKTVNFYDYGEVIHTGDGENPSEQDELIACGK